MLSLIPMEWVTGAVLGIIALIAAWFGGRVSGKTDAKLKEAEKYRDTRKAMDDATDALGDDPAVLRDSLRERGQRDRNL